MPAATLESALRILMRRRHHRADVTRFAIRLTLAALRVARLSGE